MPTPESEYHWTKPELQKNLKRISDLHFFAKFDHRYMICPKIDTLAAAAFSLSQFDSVASAVRSDIIEASRKMQDCPVTENALRRMKSACSDRLLGFFSNVQKGKKPVNISIVLVVISMLSREYTPLLLQLGLLVMTRSNTAVLSCLNTLHLTCSARKIVSFFDSRKKVDFSLPQPFADSQVHVTLDNYDRFVKHHGLGKLTTMHWTMFSLFGLPKNASDSLTFILRSALASYRTSRDPFRDASAVVPPASDVSAAVPPATDSETSSLPSYQPFNLPLLPPDWFTNFDPRTAITLTSDESETLSVFRDSLNSLANECLREPKPETAGETRLFEFIPDLAEKFRSAKGTIMKEQDYPSSFLPPLSTAPVNLDSVREAIAHIEKHVPVNRSVRAGFCCLFISLSSRRCFCLATKQFISMPFRFEPSFLGLFPCLASFTTSEMFKKRSTIPSVTFFLPLSRESCIPPMPQSLWTLRSVFWAADTASFFKLVSQSDFI